MSIENICKKICQNKAITNTIALTIISRLDSTCDCSSVGVMKCENEVIVFHFKSLQVERFTYHGTAQKHAMNVDNLWICYSNTRFQRMVFIYCCSPCMYIHPSLRKYTFFSFPAVVVVLSIQPFFSLSYTYPIRGINVSVSLLTHRGVLSGSSTLPLDWSVQ